MLEYKNRSFVKVFTDTGRRADSGRIEKDTDKREKREKADQKRKPCGEKSVAFKSGKPCKRGLYIRISFFLENAFICHWCMYCRNGSDRLTVSTEMETACHCADRHVFGTSGIYP